MKNIHSQADILKKTRCSERENTKRSYVRLIQKQMPKCTVNINADGINKIKTTHKNYNIIRAAKRMELIANERENRTKNSL